MRQRNFAATLKLPIPTSNNIYKSVKKEISSERPYVPNKITKTLVSPRQAHNYKIQSKGLQPTTNKTDQAPIILPQKYEDDPIDTDAEISIANEYSRVLEYSQSVREISPL